MGGLRLGLLGIGLALTSLALGCEEPPPGEEPAHPVPPGNVLLYLVDTLRADTLGAYGNPLPLTPNADRLAREGILFENAHAQSSWTRPSVASILTGRHPPSHGAESRRDRLASRVETLAAVLSAEGYQTGFITTNPNVGAFFGFDRGFDEVIELYERRAAGRVLTRELITPSDEVTRRAVSWLQATDADRPFFLVVHTIDPHTPYSPPKAFDRYRGDYKGRVDGTRRWINEDRLSEADRERIRSLYYGEVAFNDDSLGVLIAAMEAQGRLDDTLIVLTSDHGEELWEYGLRGHGKSLRDNLTHVPLIVRLPGATHRQRVARPVELVDVMPTVLDWLGLPLAPMLDGRSLLGAGPPDPDRIQLSSLVLGKARLHAARQHPFKLVRDLSTGREDLFDLSSEETPLAEGAEPEVRRRLSAAIDAMEAAKILPSEVDESEPSTALSPEMEAALRELGYIEGSEEGEVAEGQPSGEVGSP